MFLDDGCKGITFRAKCNNDLREQRKALKEIIALLKGGDEIC